MKNELTVIINESGLSETKGQILLDNFGNYFQIASEWEKKAKVIVVTDAGQKADMQMARVGRLFLREKRISIEKTRKGLKEQSLREGKAIDGIANVLKSVIVPIEKYLDEQEHFVEIQEQARLKALRIEEEEKAEKERIAKEKAEKEEQEKERQRILKENEKLKKENQAQRDKVLVEKRKQNKRIWEERQKRENLEQEQREQMEKTNQEKMKKEKAERELREEKEASRKYRENLIKCPKCGFEFEIE